MEDSKLKELLERIEAIENRLNNKELEQFKEWHKKIQGLSCK